MRKYNILIIILSVLLLLYNPIKVYANDIVENLEPFEDEGNEKVNIESSSKLNITGWLINEREIRPKNEALEDKEIYIIDESLINNETHLKQYYFVIRVPNILKNSVFLEMVNDINYHKRINKLQEIDSNNTYTDYLYVYTTNKNNNIAFNEVPFMLTYNGNTYQLNLSNKEYKWFNTYKSISINGEDYLYKNIKLSKNVSTIYVSSNYEGLYNVQNTENEVYQINENIEDIKQIKAHSIKGTIEFYDFMSENIDISQLELDFNKDYYTEEEYQLLDIYTSICIYDTYEQGKLDFVITIENPYKVEIIESTLNRILELITLRSKPLILFEKKTSSEY